MFTAALALGVLVAACGSDDEANVSGSSDAAPVTDAATEGTDAPDEATDTDTASSDGDAPAATVDDGAAAAGAAGTGIVEIDGTRFDVTVIDCIDLAGALGGRFEGVDEPDNVRGDFSFSPDDWESRDASEGWEEPGSVTLRVEDPYLQWETGASLVEGYNLPDGVSADEIVVSSFDIDEQALSVRGKATFFEVNSLFAGSATEPAYGTFEFNCPAG
jgi:hypothetical protein